jgi:hypothetical protein
MRALFNGFMFVIGLGLGVVVLTWAYQVSRACGVIP